MSTCFVCAWYWWSFSSAMADLLSKKSVVGKRIDLKTCEINKQSQMASLAAYVTLTYSDSTVDSVTTYWHFALQETVPPLIIKAYPDIA